MLPSACQRDTFFEVVNSKSEVKKGYSRTGCFQKSESCLFVFCAHEASKGSFAKSARATLLRRGDAARTSLAESDRATLLRRGDASRGSSTASARAALLRRGDASRGSSTDLPERPCCGELMLEADSLEYALFHPLAHHVHEPHMSLM